MRTSAQDVHTVCAIGDSHVERHSFFITELQHQLGDNYSVVPMGRRGWTTQRWIEAGDFGTVCGQADVVLISLGGNDRTAGVRWSVINHNLEVLIAQLPSTVHVVYHMTVPRYYRPRLSLASDGIHLTFTGARTYARIVAPHLIVD